MRCPFSNEAIVVVRRVAGAILVSAGVITGCRSEDAAPRSTEIDSNQRVSDPVQEQPTETSRFADERRFYRSQDQFLPADFPKFVSSEEADFLSDDDEVLGFVVAGRARAYGLQATCYHHVINDRIGEQPIAVTY
ncbi:MAG: hypothetical protein CMJ59_11895 [Planctomycetaceae bacterium]|nr:hypothetical protein [Planctomycetaceae bacterium]